MSTQPRRGSLLAAILCVAGAVPFLAVAASGCAPIRHAFHVRHVETLAAYEHAVSAPCYALVNADVIVTAIAPAHCPERAEVESVARLVQHRDAIHYAVLVFVPDAIDCDSDGGGGIGGCSDPDLHFAYVQAHFGWAHDARHELQHLALAGEGHDDPNHTSAVWRVVDGPPPFADPDYGATH